MLLHVEDDAATSYLLSVALDEIGLAVELHHVSDGDSALRFLHHQAEYASSPSPDLILLDINLPKKSGMDVLSEIHYSPALCQIPVVVFTSSSLTREKTQALSLGAQEFITKPANFDAFLGAVRSACSILAT
ncbi:MAG TPA: response regulator [Bryobacteraceae bacterium]